MTTTGDQHSPGDVVRKAARKQRAGAAQMLLVGVVVAVLTAALYYALDQKQQADEAKRRAQDTAAYCAQPGVSKPECKAEVVKGEQGEPGPPGPGPTDEQVASSVDAYFEANPLEVPGVDPAQLESTVAAYLTAHPPAPGRPPTPREIAEEVARQLRTNPPPAGENGTDGQDGMSWVDARLTADCRLVLTRSDGQERTMGPICGQDGKDGKDGADSTVPGPQGPPGPACPDGYHVETRMVVTSQAPLGEPAAVCLAD